MVLGQLDGRFNGLSKVILPGYRGNPQRAQEDHDRLEYPVH